MFLCGQAAECEVSFIIRSINIICQSTRRHTQDNRHLHTLRHMFMVEMINKVSTSQWNSPTLWIHRLTAIVLVPGWRGNGGSVWSYCSPVTFLNNDPSSASVHETAHCFLSCSSLNMYSSFLTSWLKAYSYMTWRNPNSFFAEDNVTVW
jgi:hypothetical protein